MGRKQSKFPVEKLKPFVEFAGKEWKLTKSSCDDPYQNQKRPWIFIRSLPTLRYQSPSIIKSSISLQPGRIVRWQEAWSEATEAALAGEARESFRAQQVPDVSQVGFVSSKECHLVIGEVVFVEPVQECLMNQWTCGQSKCVCICMYSNNHIYIRIYNVYTHMIC